ncbi:hypothetical protein CEXT_724941 [Caerostris extrusa]|uniref:Uncharacterized protein n=1 Tax=Caerostris extrusa TaxID=172846 RepID=A0AAV4XN13_CAEEX|nr:hypothetical protein CEXT_724941 [Caerostris extrusa]
MQAFQAATSVIRIDSYIVKDVYVICKARHSAIQAPLKKKKMKERKHRYQRSFKSTPYNVILRKIMKHFAVRKKPDRQKYLADSNLRRLLNWSLKTPTFQTSAKAPAKSKSAVPKDTL